MKQRKLRKLSSKLNQNHNEKNEFCEENKLKRQIMQKSKPNKKRSGQKKARNNQRIHPLNNKDSGKRSKPQQLCRKKVVAIGEQKFFTAQNILSRLTKTYFFHQTVKW